MADSAPIERAVYTVPEVMKLLDLGRSATYDAIRRGEIPSITIGRRIIVPKPALDKLLADA